MYLTKLRLKNFRSYEDAVINFPKGFTLFEGDIGSGKSSILYAIEFALFGLSDLKPSEIMRHGSTRTEIALRMELDGKDYEFHRALTHRKDSYKQTDCRISFDGRLRELSVDEMKAEVLNLLRFRERRSSRSHSVIFRYAFFAPQEEMKNILADTAEERLETIRRAFGIEQYRIAANNAEELRRRLSIRAELIVEKERAIMTTKEELNTKKAELENLKQILSENEKILAEKRTQVEKLRAECDGLERLEKALLVAEKNMELSRKAVEHRTQTLMKLNERLEALKKDELRAKELEPRVQAYEQLRAEYERLQQLINERTKLETSLKAELQRKVELEQRRQELLCELGFMPELERKLAQLREAIAELETLKERDTELKERLAHLRALQETVRTEIASLETEQKELLTLGAGKNCPKCKQQLTAEHLKLVIEELNHALEAKRCELKKHSSEEEGLRAMLTELATRLHGLQSLQKELMQKERELARQQTSQREIEKIGSDLNALLPRISQLEAKLTSTTDPRVESRRVQKLLMNAEKDFREHQQLMGRIRDKTLLERELAITERELEQEQTKFAENEKDVKKLRSSFSPETLSEKRALLEHETDELNILKTERSALETRIEDRLQQSQKLEIELEELERERTELLRISELCRWLEEGFIPAVKTIEEHALARYNLEFNELFQKWFSQLIEDPELEVQVDERFVPLVRQQGYELSVNGLSGGERTSLALAYRLALNSLVKEAAGIAGGNFMLLDEPTDGFSKDQIFKLRDILSETGCSQIIVVSHEKELESFADNVIRVEKLGGVSKIIQE